MRQNVISERNYIKIKYKNMSIIFPKILKQIYFSTEANISFDF